MLRFVNRVAKLPAPLPAARLPRVSLYSTTANPPTSDVDIKFQVSYTTNTDPPITPDFAAAAAKVLESCNNYMHVDVKKTDNGNIFNVHELNKISSKQLLNRISILLDEPTTQIKDVSILAGKVDTKHKYNLNLSIKRVWTEKPAANENSTPEKMEKAMEDSKKMEKKDLEKKMEMEKMEKEMEGSKKMEKKDLEKKMEKEMEGSKKMEKKELEKKMEMEMEGSKKMEKKDLEKKMEMEKMEKEMEDSKKMEKKDLEKKMEMEKMEKEMEGSKKMEKKDLEKKMEKEMEGSKKMEKKELEKKMEMEMEGSKKMEKKDLEKKMEMEKMEKEMEDSKKMEKKDLEKKMEMEGSKKMEKKDVEEKKDLEVSKSTTCTYEVVDEKFMIWKLCKLFTMQNEEVVELKVRMRKKNKEVKHSDSIQFVVERPTTEEQSKKMEEKDSEKKKDPKGFKCSTTYQELDEVYLIDIFFALFRLQNEEVAEVSVRMRKNEGGVKHPNLIKYTVERPVWGY